MVEQARELEKLMSFFKINEGEASEEHIYHETKPKLAAVNEKVVQKKAGANVVGIKNAARPAAKPAKAVGDKSSYSSDWKEF